MSKRDERSLAQTYGLTVAAVREYHAANAPLHQPAAFLRWLRANHEKESSRAQKIAA